jgi:hypothetical protein
MLKLDTKQRFIFGEVAILAWAASVQRASLYNPKINVEERKSSDFRKAVLGFVETTLLPKYKNTCSEADHIANIQSLTAFATEVGKALLGEEGYKIGVAQKLLNLLLKYLWCLGYIVEPPHCPIDRIVIAQTSLRGQLNWTEIKSVEQYSNAIAAVRILANEQSQTLANWELQFYKRR